MPLYPTDIQLAGLNLHHFTSFIPGVVDYEFVGNIIVPCHRLVAVLDIPHRFYHCISSSMFIKCYVFTCLISKVSVCCNSNNVRHQ